MTLHISAIAYEVEISHSPDALYAELGDLNDDGVRFSDFGFASSGSASYRMLGLQIGVTRTAPGRSISVGGDHRAQSFTSDVFAIEGPGHQGDSRWTGGFRGKFLKIAPNTLEQMLRTPLSQIAIDPVACDLSEHRSVYHLLSALGAEGLGAGRDGALLLESVAVAVLRASGIQSRDRAPKSPTLSQAQAAIMYELIQSRLTQSLSLAEMATAVGLSESYFVRTFKGSFGVSPYKYVLRERVSRAQSLIRSGGLSLAEVAALSGFADANRMSRTFRQMTGRGPTGAVKSRRPAEA